MITAFRPIRVLVRGGGDLGSGVIYRLARAGLPVIVLERETPTFVRREVCFGEAVYRGQIEIEGVTARCVDDLENADALLPTGIIPVLIDPSGHTLAHWQPTIVIDARMEKRNTDTRIDQAPLVICLGPGFSAGFDCHAVIETNRGHDLGRVILRGNAEPDTGEPGSIGGYTHTRVLRAPAAGHVIARCAVGDTVAEGEVIAMIGDESVIAAFGGVLRGIIHEKVSVSAGMKIGDLDPRASRRHCFTISDKSLAIGGGALEAILSAPQVRTLLP